jgi:hypothetical protein
MRKMIAALSVIAVVLTGTPAFATNCAASTGSGTCCGGMSWYEYSAETLGEGNISYQCWTIDSGLTPISSSAWWSLPAFEVHGISQVATRTFTVPNDGYSTHWEADLRVDFVDPHTSFYNNLVATVSVYHSGSGTTNYTLYSHYGTAGNDRGHSAYVTISAQTGDVITFTIQGTSSGDSDSHIQFFDARLFHFAS